MIGLTLAVLLSCLGLSALRMLKTATLRPLTFVAGGQIMITDIRTEITTAGNTLYADALTVKPYKSEIAEDLISEVVVDATLHYTLVAPYQYIYRGNKISWQYIFARDNPSETLTDLYLLQGDYLSGNEEENTIIMVGPQWDDMTKAWDGSSVNMNHRFSIPELVEINGVYDWNATVLVSESYFVKGIHDYNKTLYFVEWTELETLQKQVGGDSPVSWVSIETSLDQMDSLKKALEQKIQEDDLPLKVLTIYDLGSMLLGDFSRLEKMTDYYVPVMLFVAILIVMINTVALTISRKKELALLRVLGMSQSEVQLSFLVECMLTAVIGGALGTALASGLGVVLAKDPSVSLLPLLVCIVSTMLISGISIFVLSKGSLSNTIHN
jgi:hypothetical protein